MSFFSPIRFLSFSIAFAIGLFHSVVRSQNAEFVGFNSFEFAKELSGNSSDSLFFTFAIPNNKSTPLNVTLSTEANSGIVLSAHLCAISPRSFSSADWSLPSNGILAATALSDQFQSVLLRPASLPLSDQCPPTNHSSADQSALLLLLEVRSLVGGSHGTLAVRKNDAADGAMAFPAEGMPNELEEQSAEWSLIKGQQPLLLPIHGNCSVEDCSNLVRFSAHLAIRQGSVELALVQQCDNNSSSNGSLKENQKFFLLDNFLPGEYLRFMDIHFGDNGTANGTILRGNHSEHPLELSYCPLSAQLNESSSSSYGNIQLIISSSSSQPSLVALSQLRTFNARHLTQPGKGPSIGHFALFVLLLVISLVFFGFLAVFLSRRFFLQQRRVHKENEEQQQQQKEGAHFEMDQMRENRPPSTISKREGAVAEVKINASALEERAIGGSNGGGWM
ncbi:hypothetical protein niasHT_037671 [Heterodera trifolii]|uniref:Uncharacterized protein n=1 Tax=Heterodera trifolii TaxID=157864 RepID=A0ABD2IJ99_9BILA